MSQRRKFSAQFKAEAVQLVLQSGRPIAEVARELQINDGTPVDQAFGFGAHVRRSVAAHPAALRPVSSRTIGSGG